MIAFICSGRLSDGGDRVGDAHLDNPVPVSVTSVLTFPARR